ncbi:hypothetical protein PoB_006868800 [Plakobranchus ocellatus]|uniref:Uncharacterized protein n=1 Tax=Plakobranchus ocellatus TaxID=259542 RepID=A0AAV4DD69_9GAST|nr:hypothetical protein PoB_006868800 [Plakobranchus ocellatus]
MLDIKSLALPRLYRHSKQKPSLNSNMNFLRPNIRFRNVTDCLTNVHKFENPAQNTCSSPKKLQILLGSDEIHGFGYVGCESSPAKTTNDGCFLHH